VLNALKPKDQQQDGQAKECRAKEETLITHLIDENT
jgi:hypothetical protein